MLILATFSPQGYPNGKVVYDFSLSNIDENFYSLYDIEPYRQLFAVFALTSYNEGIESGELETGLKNLRKKYPSAILHKVLVFGVPNKGLLEGSKHILPILSSKVSSFTSLETALCDITSDFLAELAVYVISRQMGSFKSPGIKILDTPRDNSDKPYNTSIRRGLLKHSPSGTPSISRAASVSKTGSISLGLSDRTKSKQHGRMVKFLGNMYLLAGRLPEALRDFTEAASILKSCYDHLWYASALEGIGVCLVLQAFLEVPITIPAIAMSATMRSHSHRDTESSASLPLSSPSLSSMTPPLSPAQSMPVRPHERPHLPHSASFSSLPNAAPGLGDFLPDLTDAVLRFYARSTSSSEESVPQIIYCEAILRFIKLLVISRQGGGWNGATLSAIVRGTSLAKNVTRDSPSATTIAEWCNRIYSTDLSNMPISAQCRVYCGLAGIYSSAGLARKKSFVLRELMLRLIPRMASDGNANLGTVLRNFDSTRRPGLIEFLDGICQVFGGGDITSIGCGWMDLKMSFLKSSISICESADNYEGVVHFASLLLSIMADSLSKEEQLRLFASIHKAIELCRKSGQGPVLAHYWDRYLLRDIRLVPSTSVVPIPQAPPTTTTDDSTDVFLYNPYAKRDNNMDLDDRVLIQGERADFLVKLQNPFEFEIHVSEVSLLTADMELNAVARNVFLPASSMYELTLSAVPRAFGKLKILGCKIQVSGCNPEEYLLSYHALPRAEPKIKQLGVNSGVKKTVQNASSRELEYEVIPAQPVAALNYLSLNHGWLMVLEGEKQVFSMSLSNLSDTTMNLIQFSFLDSTQEHLQAALGNKELALNEVYECEYFLYKRRSLKLVDPANKEIPAHEAGMFEFQVLGKRGMVNATINIDYGNHDHDTGSTVWTRRLSVPINITVNSSVELVGCDVVPLPRLVSDDHALTRLEGLCDPLEKDGRYVILIIDLRNLWSRALEVTLFSNKDETSRLAEFKQLIYPSRTNRFMLPVKWDGVSQSILDNLIPSLGKRQYVVDTNMTVDQARLMRETFWYREELLKLIGGTWRLEGSEKSGSVELRGLRLTRTMVNALRVDSIGISMTVWDSQKGDAVKQLNETTWQAKVENENCVVRTTISNATDQPVGGMLRLIPSMRYNEGGVDNDEIHKKIIYNGVLQRPIINIEPGKAVDVDLGLIILSRGEYEWTSIFEAFKGPEISRQYVQREPLFVKAV
jgi:hypothetical protein